MGAGRPKFRIWLVILAASKKNVTSGEFLVEAFSQLIGVLGDRTVLLALKRNQDVAIIASDGRAVAEGEVEAAEGNTDVVDDGVDFARRNHLADFVIDIGEDQLRSSSMRVPTGRPSVQPQLAGIHGRKEILTHERDQAQRADHEHGEHGQYQAAMLERPIQQARISGSHPLEAAG